MKTAILISGELRTFSICRPTMTFLDDPNADIYVSTWDKSIVKNERLNLNKVDLISEESIAAILNRPATIMVEPLSCIDEKKYNSKMIHRWLAGMQMILNSEQDYDYVLVTRPDLFFNHTHPSMFTLDSLILDSDKQFAWYEAGHKLQDNLFFAKFETMKDLFARLSVQVWEKTKEGDWHTWWTNFVGWTEVKRLGGHVPFTFCRPIVKEGMNFQDVFRCYLDWRDMQIMTQVEIGNRAAVVKDWGEAEVVKAEAKSFERYKIVKPRVAVLISGEYRTFAACRKTMKFLDEENVDVYFSTWDKSKIIQPRLGLNIQEDITEEKIINDLGFVPSGISLKPYQDASMKRNSGMLWNYFHGAQMIKDKDYSHVIVMRPDLFFPDYISDDFCEDMLKDVESHDIAAGWRVEENHLGDMIYICKLEIFLDIFKDTSSIQEWESCDLYWHKWWHDLFATKKYRVLDGTTPRKWHNFTICRFTISTDINFSLAVNSHDLWLEAALIDGANLHGIKFGPHWKAEAYSKSGKIAVLICGMMRNFEKASSSWDVLKQLNADWFISTWDKSDVHEDFNRDFESILDKSTISKIHAHDKFNPFGQFSKCGTNSKRFQHLLFYFADKLMNYSKVIIIRPDCAFIGAADFSQTELTDNVVYSHIVRDDFIQDFVMLVPPEYFKEMHKWYMRMLEQDSFNPHIEILNYCREIDLPISQLHKIDATLIR